MITYKAPSGRRQLAPGFYCSKIYICFCSIASFNTLWGSSHKHCPLVLLASVAKYLDGLTGGRVEKRDVVPKPYIFIHSSYLFVVL